MYGLIIRCDDILTAYSDGPVQGVRFGCNIIKANDVSVFYYLTVLASETSIFTFASSLSSTNLKVSVIITLTIIKAMQHWRSRSSWILQLSRDGQ